MERKNNNKKKKKKIIADCTPGSLPGLRVKKIIINKKKKKKKKKKKNSQFYVEVLKPPTYQIKQTE